MSDADDQRLICVECGTASDDGDAWRGELVTDDEQVDEDEVAVYCPECWDREFGWRSAR
jgi:hypothetical protein